MAVHVDRSLRLPQSEYFPDPQTKSGSSWISGGVCRLSGPLGPVRRRVAQTPDQVGKIDRPDRGTGGGLRARRDRA